MKTLDALLSKLPSSIVLAALCIIFQNLSDLFWVAFSSGPNTSLASAGYHALSTISIITLLLAVLRRGKGPVSAIQLVSLALIIVLTRTATASLQDSPSFMLTILEVAMVIVLVFNSFLALTNNINPDPRSKQ